MDIEKPHKYGRAFVDLFRELGYDEGELHSDMFEWLFGLPSMRIQAFLDWFLTSIRPRQSVKRQLGGPQDYAIYRTLLTQGVLTGEQLVRAEIACQSDMAMQQDGAQEDSLDVLLRGNARLEHDIQAMENRLRLANERNDRLAKLTQRLAATTDHQTQRLQRQQNKEQFAEILAQVTIANRRRRMGTVPTPEHLLRRIQSTLQHLTPPEPVSASNAIAPDASTASSLVVAPTMGSMVAMAPSMTELTLREQTRQWKDFMYHHNMEPLQAQEETNLRSLQAKIPAISALSSTPRLQSSGEGSEQVNGSTDVQMSPAPPSQQQDLPPPSPWLHESDPTQLNMREQDTLLYNKCCVELERLRKAFVVGERDSLLSHLQMTRYEAHLRQLTTSRRQLLQQFQLMNHDAIWARKQILQASIDKTKKQLSELFQHAFPEKLEELAFLKSTSILLHSYEQKLWRQENRFVKLRLLLQGFEMQSARLRLAHRLLDAEREDLIQVDSLFQQFVATLGEHNDRIKERIGSYDTTSGSDAARTTLSQTYLHDHDAMAHLLFEILGHLVQRGEHTQPAPQSTQLRTFDELVRLCELKCANEQRLEETTVRAYYEWKRLYDSKRSTLNQLRKEMFGDVTSSTPMVLPRDVTVALEHASESKDAAELGLEKALETLRLHKRSIQVDPTKRMQQERDIARLQRELQA